MSTVIRPGAIDQDDAEAMATYSESLPAKP